MHLYDVINPSDPITFEAPDDAIATVVGIVLSGGAYPVKRVEPDGNVDLFGVHFPGMSLAVMVAELAKHEVPAVEQGGGVSIDRSWWAARGRELVAALRTVAVVSVSDRRALRAALGAGFDHAALARWSKERRSSMNDIAGRAYANADYYEREYQLAT